ncbi:MAG: hypothetical protein IPK44_14840 [Candidatus Accumulibacter sp.]|uniref:hypothetical protein n=1 Tax=Accumulibacter sp. TaxID=2053492 RepID=UPI002585ABE6|nr:hypothetical protein [Accumulibacter sp.]MBK8115693.1 hypothetical protein [Accumulibacter sp.]
MSSVQEFLQRDPGHFMSLRDVLTRMAADGANHKEAAQALRRLLMWSPDLRDRPEWVVSGPDELWVAEDEDTGRPWKHLERATHSGLPPTGGRGEKAFDRFGFFAGVIIPFLAKNGIDISTDQSSTTPGPTGEQEQANIPPAVSEETPEQSETAPSGTPAKNHKPANVPLVIVVAKLGERPADAYRAEKARQKAIDDADRRRENERNMRAREANTPTQVPDEAQEQSGTVHSGAQGKTTMTAKQAGLLKIVEALERYAEETKQPFERQAMPGPLGNSFNDEGSFHWLCAQLDRTFMKAPTTFETYRARICAVAKYAKKSDFYRSALPHIAPIFSGAKKASQEGKK